MDACNVRHCRASAIRWKHLIVDTPSVLPAKYFQLHKEKDFA